MIRQFAICIVLIALAACGKKPPVVQPTIVEVVKTVEVKVAVPVKAQPPAELLAAVVVPLPVFVAPSSPEASSALTAEGERMLRALLEELLAKLRAWQAWASEP